MKKKSTKERVKEETAKHNKASEKKTETLKELCIPDESYVYSVVKKKLTKEKETCNEEASTLLYAVVDTTSKESPQVSTDNRKEEITAEDQSNGRIRMEIKEA